MAHAVEPPPLPSKSAQNHVSTSRQSRTGRFQDAVEIGTEDRDHVARQIDAAHDGRLDRFRRRGVFSATLHWLIYEQPGWLTSFLVHVLLLLILAMIMVRLPARPSVLKLSFAAPGDSLDLTEVSLDPAGEAPEPVPVELVDLSEVDTDLIPEVALPTAPVVHEMAITSSAEAAAETLEQAMANMGGFVGRSGRRGMAGSLGATPESEGAVDRALVWLAAHQRPNGSWNFTLRGCNCPGCAHAGTGDRAVAGATALALLPFLGAGQTHEKGYHRKTIEKGLLYLIKVQGSDGSYHESQGRMYSHGLAALALCEALAMTETDPGDRQDRYRKQRRLRRAAQLAVRFIVNAQHSRGGWRYRPKERGDTSVVGWQAMALQSAKSSKLEVPEDTLSRTGLFLDSVQRGNYGGYYGYTSPGVRPGTTAVGLLTRMYLGWKRDHPGIEEGVEYLNQVGPSVNNVYFNYYATQVLHHYRGPIWEEWHPMLRDHLVDTQATKGHESGSWYFPDDFGSTLGGRLYITAMSAMILEVYYRHMPIYRFTSESSVRASAEAP